MAEPVLTDTHRYIRFLEATSTKAGTLHPSTTFLQLRLGQRCLDIGCGIGEDARSIAHEFGAEVVGLDHNAGMVDEARSRSVGFNGVSFETGEAVRLPFPDSSFDAVWIKRRPGRSRHRGGPSAEARRASCCCGA